MCFQQGLNVGGVMIIYVVVSQFTRELSKFNRFEKVLYYFNQKRISPHTHWKSLPLDVYTKVPGQRVCWTYVSWSLYLKQVYLQELLTSELT